MAKRLILAAILVIVLFAIACLYVGGVASLSDRVVHWFRPGPKMAAPGTMASAGWELFSETAHFRYYVRSGDHIPSWAMGLAEDHLKLACQQLGITPLPTIHFYKHPSQSDLYEATGSNSTGVTLVGDGQRQEVHSVHGYDAHEVMHALAHEALGQPPALFDEGLATAFGWDWTPGENDVHQRATALLDEGRVVPLQRLLTDWDFRSYKTYPAYTEAGSFVKYLLQTHGPGKLSKLFALDRYSPLEEIEEKFAAAYGESIYALEEDWRAALQSGVLLETRERPVATSSNTPLVVTAVALFAATFLLAILIIVAGERVVGAGMRRLHAWAQNVRNRWGGKPRS